MLLFDGKPSDQALLIHDSDKGDTSRRASNRGAVSKNLLRSPNQESKSDDSACSARSAQSARSNAS